jgi:hypothetical protein
LLYNERACSHCKKPFWSKGRKYVCNPCANAYARVYHRDLKRRESRRDARYGLEAGGWQKLFDAQGGLCASCQDVLDPTSRAVHTDHDWSCCSWTGRSNTPLCGKCVRGLLCDYCNVMIGQAKEDPQRLRMGAAYLDRRAVVTD